MVASQERFLFGERVALFIFDEIDAPYIFHRFLLILLLKSSQLISSFSESFISVSGFRLKYALPGLTESWLAASTIVKSLMPKFIIEVLNILLDRINLSPDDVRTSQSILFTGTRKRSLQPNSNELLDSLEMVVFGYTRKVRRQFRQLTDNFLHFYIQMTSNTKATLAYIQFSMNVEEQPSIAQRFEFQEFQPQHTLNRSQGLNQDQRGSADQDARIKQQSMRIQQSQRNSKPNEDEAGLSMIDVQNYVANVGGKRRNRSAKERKIRTIITKEKLLKMNQIFTEYVTDKNRQNGEVWTLKKIAVYLQLGYSTILHKYREFRANKKVKAGALISSRQRKRKYKKSVLVEEYIKKALQQQQFFTASQMTTFIEQKYGTKFSRSIISRHLGEMGYSYKNVSHSVKALNPNARYQSTRKNYAQLMLPFISSSQTLIFVDELSCCFNSGQSDQYSTISILLACTIHGILFFHIQQGFFSRQQFFQIIKKFFINLKESAFCQNIQGENGELHLVLDLNKIHRDDSEGTPGLAQMLVQENIELYYIPPCSPQLNPIEPVFEKIKERVLQRVGEHEAGNLKRTWEILESIMEEIQHEPTDVYFLEMYEELEKCMKATSKK